MPFDDHLLRTFRDALAAIPAADAPGIYAVSLLVGHEDDDPQKPTITIGYNTESQVKRVLEHAPGRFLLCGMAAAPDPGGTRFGFLGGIRMPGATLLHPLIHLAGPAAVRLDRLQADVRRHLDPSERPSSLSPPWRRRRPRRHPSGRTTAGHRATGRRRATRSNRAGRVAGIPAGLVWAMSCPLV
jgi:hypothetical protein